MSEPTHSQLETLMSLPVDAPVAALNLFQFRSQAQYQPEDPEYGAAEGNVSGQEAFARYSESAGPFIVKLGGHVAFSTPVDQVMIGPEQPDWDIAAIMFFPTRRAFMQMLSDPDFQQASRHRKAALENHCMLHLNGEPFQNG